MIPVNEPLLDGNEMKYLKKCIETGWISSEGPFVKEFENKFAERVNRKHAIAVSNGTVALDVSIEALGIKHGDEVILPSFTIISCVLQIVRSGAKPVFIDSDPKTWNMDIKLIEERITPRTRAILAVHIYGLPVDMDPLLALAEKYNLRVIEDAAEMIGQTYKRKPCGSFGDLSTFSFYTNKHITTGEGGMVVTDDNNLAEQVRSLRNLCFEENRRFVHNRLGWNLRMTNLQAAIGLAQLERLDEFIIKKRKIGEAYQSNFSDLTGVTLPLTQTNFSKNIYWVYGIVLNKEVGMSSEQIREKLLRAGIGTRPFFYPLHKQPILQKLGLVNYDEHCPVSENLYQNGFYIPSGLALTDEQINTVSASVIKTVTEYEQP